MNKLENSGTKQVTDNEKKRRFYMKARVVA